MTIFYADGQFTQVGQPHWPWYATREQIREAVNAEGKFRAALPPISGIAQYTSFRLETKQRGGSYWVAYRRIEGQLKKHYVCKRDELTEERITAAARRMQAVWQSSPSPSPG